MQHDRVIEGWRGVSVIFVILGHLIGYRYRSFFEPAPSADLFFRGSFDPGSFVKYVLLHSSDALSMLGVYIFFVISGYLIVGLMLSEYDTHGRFNLKAFYLRRAFRILPAFYFYILVIYILYSLGEFDVQSSAVFASALFLCDLKVTDCTWIFGHSWTLAVEQQFYLALPLCFLLLGRKKFTSGLLLSLGGLCLLSFNHGLALSFAHIAVGALLASSEKFRSFISGLNPRLMQAFVAIILALPFLKNVAYIHKSLLVTLPFMTASIFYFSLNKSGVVRALLSSPVFQAAGALSYSLYLWQQLTTGQPTFYKEGSFLLFPFLFLVPSVLSYMLVERPLVGMGRRLSRKLVSGRADQRHLA